MKSTGIVRKMDELGRIVLPMEIRTVFEINPKDPLEIFVENGRIILQKYQPSCIFCGNADNNVILGEKRVCKACIEKLGKLSEDK
ncbi:MAG: AbrB/MazE/SpoVT family DNA-binding domain-containing protein [Clostridia bacterium]|nr:AbrB/MazE/SpoVT family DNA-binding domain-containing protein [Clostridia bacterium]